MCREQTVVITHRNVDWTHVLHSNTKKGQMCSLTLLSDMGIMRHYAVRGVMITRHYAEKSELTMRYYAVRGAMITRHYAVQAEMTSWHHAERGVAIICHYAENENSDTTLVNV